MSTRPTWRSLRAGPLELQLGDEGDLRYLRAGGREVLRRVYVAVRDQRWDTIVPRVEDLRVEEAHGGFRVTFLCKHQRGDVDFAWRGEITGDARGTVRYAMAGQANAPFLRNRIGICVLHGPDAAGQPYRLTHPDGTTEEGRLPTSISPHQPAMAIRGFDHEVAPGLWAELAFEGEVFEMEDQRNWTDASFKIYSTPLALPMPVQVNAGDRVEQTVTLTLRGDVPAASARAGSDEPTIELGEVVGPLPPIGLALGEPLAEGDPARLWRLGLAHLRVELRLGDAGHAALLERAVREAAALDAALEVALVLPETGAEAALDGLRRWLDAPRPRVAHWIVHRIGEPSTSDAAVALARAALGGVAPGAPFGGGVLGSFVDLNRNRPGPGLDFLAYAVTPQVHAFDDASMVETLAGQGWTVANARAFGGGRPVVVTPVTLWSTFAPAPDPRQATPFAAAWTLGSLKHLAEAGAAAVTYFETAGPSGVVGTSIEALLAKVARNRGAEVVASRSSDPLLVEALALRSASATTVLLANLTPIARTARVGGRRVELPPHGWSALAL